MDINGPNCMDNLELRDLTKPLLKWWWLIVATTLVALVSCYLFVQSQPAIYQARTTLIVGTGVLQDPNPNNSQLGITEQLAQAYADMAQRTLVSQATMDVLGLDVLPTYTVNTVTGSPVIEIVVTDANPELAQAVAQELVHQLIMHSPVGQEGQDRQLFINEQLGKLERGITDTEAELERRQGELTGLFSAHEIADVQKEIAALQNKLTSLRGDYAALLTSSHQGSINQITVVEPASLPRQPIAESLMRYLLVAAMAGFVLGAGGAYLLEFLDDTIKSAAEARKLLGVTLLTSIPIVRADNKLVMLDDRSSAVTEAYRGLRSNVQHLFSKDAPYALLITGPAPHEGKSIACANLGITLARAGKQVILVDADLHRPVQHQLFGVPNTLGLSTALIDWTLGLDSVLLTTAVPGLHLLPSGPLPPHPSELLSTERMEMLLAELSAHADIVIIDSPPVTSVVDATELSKMVDGVILVLRANKTRRDTALRALETLRQVGAPVIGAILNGVANRSGAYSHSAYGYHNQTISGGYPGPRQRALVHRNGKGPVRKQSGLPPGQTVDVGEK